jgi:hypothetical protein
VVLCGAGALPPTPQAGGNEAAAAGGDDGALQHDPYDLDDMGNLCDMLPPTPAAADGDEAAAAVAAAGEEATEVGVAGALSRHGCGLRRSYCFAVYHTLSFAICRHTECA